MKRIRLLAWIAVAVVAAAAAGLWLERWRGEAPDQAAAVSGSFELVDQNGQAVPASWFREGPLAVFFGFTSCPDVCPTTLATLSRWLEALDEADAAELKVVFVSIDPQRDTPEAIGNYIGHFDPRIIGVTGAPEALRALASALGAEFQASGSEERYEVSHSASIYLLDRNGRFVGAMKDDTLPEIAVERLRELAERGAREPAA